MSEKVQILEVVPVVMDHQRERERSTNLLAGLIAAAITLVVAAVLIWFFPPPL